jgi:hypothetical protein
MNYNEWIKSVPQAITGDPSILSEPFGGIVPDELELTCLRTSVPMP